MLYSYACLLWNDTSHISMFAMLNVTSENAVINAL